MIVLGIDTSGILGGAAVAEPGRLLGEVRCDARAAASERLLPQVDRLLADLGLSRAAIARIGVAIGPGSFTGLRVGLATGKGLALALGVPLVPVSSLRARIRAVGAGDRAVLAVTAHRQGSVFSGGGWWTGERFREILGEASRPTAAAPEWVAEALAAARASVAGLPLICTGDAAAVLLAALGELGGRWQAGGELLCLEGQSGALPGVVALLAAEASEREALAGGDLEALVPSYLRSSDARPGRAGRSGKEGA